MIQKTRVLSLSIISSLFLFTLLVSHADAKTLYVSPSGNDSVTYVNNSASSPWATIGRAAWGSTDRNAPNANEGARAGDTVLISGGTYSYAGAVNSRWGVVYNPANSGTASNYITFTCTGDCILGAPNANSPVIGAESRNYIKWYADVSQGNSWQISAYGRQNGTASATEVNTTPDTGPVVCQGSTGCWVEGADINGGLQTDYTDNFDGIRIENAPSAVIRNNSIRNFRNLDNTSNGTGIKLYGSANSIIENNYVTNVGSAISLKDTANTLPQNNIRVRYNHLDGADRCFAISMTTEERNYFYQNLCLNYSNLGVHITGGSSVNDWFFNNTFYSSSQSFTWGSLIYLATYLNTGTRFWNNIVYNTSYGVALNNFTMQPDTSFDMEHNVYYAINTFYQGSEGNRDFAYFRSTYPDQDSSTPVSLYTDPLFVNTGSNFRLQASSPARNIGMDLYDLDNDGSTSDIIPAGAYITGSEVIGVNTGGTTPPPPSDTTPPSVSLSSPTGTVTGSVTVSASASDNVAVTGVQFRLDGTNLGSEDTASPYATTWNTTTVTNGTHTLTATARDTANNTTTSNPVTVTVNNTVTPTETIPLAPASLSASPVSTSQIDLTWTDSSTNETGFSVERKTGLSGTYAEVATVSANTTTYQNTSLAPSTQYYFRVRSYNTVGSSAYSPEATAVTAAPVVLPPTTTIGVGDRVQTTTKVNIRSTPGGKRLGTQYRNSQGVVTEGPTTYSGYSWYRVDYTSGTDGWTRGDLLTKVTTTAMNTEQIRDQIASIYLLIKQLQEQLGRMQGN